MTDPDQDCSDGVENGSVYVVCTSCVKTVLFFQRTHLGTEVDLYAQPAVLRLHATQLCCVDLKTARAKSRLGMTLLANVAPLFAPGLVLLLSANKFPGKC